MSLEAIKVIAAAETDAEKQRLDALAEAKRIIAAAEAAGKDEVQKAKDAAESQVLSLCQEAEAQGKAALAQATQEIQANCRSLEEGAGDKMDQAVAIIVERVVSG